MVGSRNGNMGGFQDIGSCDLGVRDKHIGLGNVVADLRALTFSF